MGGLSIDATHPFQEGPITLVHNGTLFRTTPLPISEYDVGAVNDSHAICHNLANHDVEEVIGKLDGAFALVWHDARDDSLNIVRNEKRPLHMSISSIDDTIYFASEGEMLHWLDARLKLGLQEIVQPKVGYWLKFLPDDVLKPKVKKVELETFPKSPYRGTTLSNLYEDSYGDWWQSQVVKDDNYEGGGDTSGKGVTTSSHTESIRTPSNRVLVNGQRRAVPMRMQEELLRYDLLVEDVLSFVPQDADEVVEHKANLHRKTNTVHGYLLMKNRNHAAHCIKAVMYGVKDAVWESQNYRIWSAQPLGVKITSDGEPMVVCKFIHSLNPSGELSRVPDKLEDVAPQYPQGFDDDIPFEIGAAEDDEAAIDMVLGPFGTLITLERFNHKARNGCIDCGDNISPNDAPNVIWVNGEQDPMCPMCTREYLTVNES